VTVVHGFVLLTIHGAAEKIRPLYGHGESENTCRVFYRQRRSQAFLSRGPKIITYFQHNSRTKPRQAGSVHYTQNFVIVFVKIAR